MKNTGRHSENSGYLVILLLVVGLTAFSHSMKELAEIHQLTLDASRLVAQWSGNFTPAEIPQTNIKIVKVETSAYRHRHGRVRSASTKCSNPRNCGARLDARNTSLHVQSEGSQARCNQI